MRKKAGHSFGQNPKNSSSSFGPNKLKRLQLYTWSHSWLTTFCSRNSDLHKRAKTVTKNNKLVLVLQRKWRRKNCQHFQPGSTALVIRIDPPQVHERVIKRKRSPAWPTPQRTMAGKGLELPSPQNNLTGSPLNLKLTHTWQKIAEKLWLASSNWERLKSKYGFKTSEQKLRRCRGNHRDLLQLKNITYTVMAKKWLKRPIQCCFKLDFFNGQKETLFIDKTICYP